MIVLKRCLSLLDGEFKQFLLPENLEVCGPHGRKLLIVVLCYIELFLCRNVGAPLIEPLSLKLALSFGILVIGIKVELGWLILKRLGT